MKRKSNLTCPAARPRKGERGAALVTTLLLSMLLLTAGGALLMSTSMSATNAFDSTSEMQAYYAAESGMQATMVVFRNVVPKVTFVNAVTPLSSNVTGDAAGLARLSKWLTYGSTAANSRVTVGNGAYTVSITDPDNTSPVKPTRLLLTVTGYGPRGAVKQLTAIVTEGLFSFQPPATITIRGADDGTAMTFAIGASNAKSYSGYDSAIPSASPLPVFAVNAADVSTANSVISGSKPGTVSPTLPDSVGQLTSSNTPSFLRSADNARALLNDLQASAVSSARYFTTQPANLGTASDPIFTFVDGDVSLGPGYQGSGLLVVTGTLSTNGNTSFDGLILALGGGTVDRSGGGNGNIMGAMIVAKFDRTSGPFQVPTFSTSGGGSSNLQYDSAKVQSALNTQPLRVLGIAEK
jgi:hypothetical protein